MAKKNSETVVEEVKGAPGTIEGEAPPEEVVTDGWTEVGERLALYQADKGKGGLVQGLLLALRTMPPAMGKPWQAFIVELTAPCAVTDRTEDGRDIRRGADVGERILVPATTKLLEHFARAAMHPQYAFEVRFKPAGTQKTPRGAMIVFKMARNPKPVLRNAEQRALALEAAAPAAPQLPAASAETDADLRF